MGYWVTLPIAVASAFHHSLHSVYISLTHSLPLSASFSRLNSACAACVCVCCELNWMATSALLCLIESAQGFPGSVCWHVQSLLSLQGMGIKQSGMFDVYAGAFPERAYLL